MRARPSRATISAGITASSAHCFVASASPSATPAATQALLRRVTYWNSSDNPSTLTRTVRAVVTDGGMGGASTPTTMTVTVTPVNDPPVLAKIPSLSATEYKELRYKAQATAPR